MVKGEISMSELTNTVYAVRFAHPDCFVNQLRMCRIRYMKWVTGDRTTVN